MDGPAVGEREGVAALGVGVSGWGGVGGEVVADGRGQTVVALCLRKGLWSRRSDERGEDDREHGCSGWRIRVDNAGAGAVLDLG